MISSQPFPKGWDPGKIQDLVQHYETQTGEEQAAEIEAALDSDKVTMMAVPLELEEAVRALITKKQTA